ncbi:MAG: cytidylate kinase-like family protein [SAR202 cluster bacterium]|nr:cytidylate kinase-like family protein [SAR202 cluster bacterium]
MSVITIGGLSGGGGRKIGPLLAKDLNFDYVDRLILTNASKSINASVNAVSQIEERPKTFGERFSAKLQKILDTAAITSSNIDPYFGPYLTSYLTEEFENVNSKTFLENPHEIDEHMLFESINKTIHELSESGDIILVGRGAHILLKDNPKALRVGIISNWEDRINNIMEREKVDKETAEEKILNRDQSRRDYFKRFFEIDNPDDPKHYHIVINASDMSNQRAIDTIKFMYNQLQN